MKEQKRLSPAEEAAMAAAWFQINQAGLRPEVITTLNILAHVTAEERAQYADRLKQTKIYQPSERAYLGAELTQEACAFSDSQLKQIVAQAREVHGAVVLKDPMQATVFERRRKKHSDR